MINRNALTALLIFMIPLILAIVFLALFSEKVPAQDLRSLQGLESVSLIVPSGVTQIPRDSTARKSGLRLDWRENILSIQGDHLPGGELKVWYMEAYCRPGSTDQDWRKETVIGHWTKPVFVSQDRRLMKLRCTLDDGVVIDHEIRATHDQVNFQLVVTNPTDKPSLALWGQPCVRVGAFTGRTQNPRHLRRGPLWAREIASTYLPKSFIFLNNKLTRMPTPDWATEARYTPGQVWRPKHVQIENVNPRPLNKSIPSNGLIGCFSSDNKMIMATAWEPYQELFQGVIVCLHSDFRIGGVQPGESKTIRGKIYLMEANVDALLERYQKDFPEHFEVTKEVETMGDKDQK